MKRIYVGALLCAILSLGLLTGCDQGVARSLGGDMTLELEPGQKLEMITWKDDSLWYLTRPMQDGEAPETHTFQQSGIIHQSIDDFINIAIAGFDFAFTICIMKVKGYLFQFYGPGNNRLKSFPWTEFSLSGFGI